MELLVVMVLLVAQDLKVMTEQLVLLVYKAQQV
jgi:hypothetical protein